MIFLDETSTPTTLTPVYARAPRGERAVGQVPKRHWTTTTFVGTLTLTGMGQAALTDDGALDREVFDAFVEQFLVPTLRPGQTILLDNLSVHKSARARRAIEAVGCHLLPLPRYSPDCNPIEQAFAKMKTALRKRQPRDYASILTATAAAMASITPDDAAHFFTAAGFPPREHVL